MQQVQKQEVVGERDDFTQVKVTHFRKEAALIRSYPIKILYNASNKEIYFELPSVCEINPVIVKVDLH